MESRAARRSISVSIVVLLMRHSFMLMLLVTHGMRLWMAQLPVHYWYWVAIKPTLRSAQDGHPTRAFASSQFSGESRDVAFLTEKPRQV
jgi:hypothetical protein